MPGIARLSESGEVELTIRDLKAKDGTDAALRLAHVVIYAAETLTGQKGVSSRKVLLPILRDWRVYYTSAKSAIANHKGILRNGDQLLLDTPAKQEAEKFISEILDDGVQGKWSPGSASRRRRPKKTGQPEEGEA